MTLIEQLDVHQNERGLAEAARTRAASAFGQEVMESLVKHAPNKYTPVVPEAPVAEV